jgi:hypothetical protein
MTPTAIHAQIPRVVRLGLIALSVVGFVGLLLTFGLGFEEPPSRLLLLAAVAMTFAAPVLALVHLAMTRTLTAESKRIWWKEFASADIWSALSEYLSSDNLDATADRRAVEADARRGLRKGR